MKKKIALPTEFKFCHDYCFFLHDQLLETLISAEKAKVFQVQFKYKDKNHAQPLDFCCVCSIRRWSAKWKNHNV